MIKGKWKAISAIMILCVIIFLVINSRGADDRADSNGKIITPSIGDVTVTVTTTGVVKPQNRLELKPSISGRIEEILVKEGGWVKKGDILVWMSSTERAALVDAARSQGEETLKYWETAYKRTPIISPIDGEIIVRSVEPGQTVIASDAVLVLSDRLVISAQFDETDIGRIHVGQDAVVTLDAYPDVKIEGSVDHVAYESEIVSNVTIYNVDILPKKIPRILRSGMSVTAEVIEKQVTGVITIPSNAIRYDGERQFVLVRDRRGKVIERDIRTGLNNDKTAEVISGLSTEENILTEGTSSLLQRKQSGSSPFMPQRKRK